MISQEMLASLGGGLPRGVQATHHRWSNDVVEAWMKEKQTVNTLCGLKLLAYVHTREDGAHCGTCRRLSHDLLDDALIAQPGQFVSRDND